MIQFVDFFQLDLVLTMDSLSLLSVSEDSTVWEMLSQLEHHHYSRHQMDSLFPALGEIAVLLNLLMALTVCSVPIIDSQRVHLALIDGVVDHCCYP